MGTSSAEPKTESSSSSPAWIERYGRRARWLHGFVYTSALILLATGLWLLTGHEGDPSPIARLTSTPDTSVHKVVGWLFAGGAVVAMMLGWRGARTFVIESIRFQRSDAGWFKAWPAATLTGRFAHHEGHFDPGQRVANAVIVLSLLALTLSGVGLVLVHGGPIFAVLVRVHRWSTYVVIPVLAGHVLIATGVLPGYRGVWRSMHLGGRVEKSVVKRLWPASLERSRQSR